MKKPGLLLDRRDALRKGSTALWEPAKGSVSLEVKDKARLRTPKKKLLGRQLRQSHPRQK